MPKQSVHINDLRIASPAARNDTLPPSTTTPIDPAAAPVYSTPN
ncbi:MAG: hypothetical protein Q8P00_06210 [Dehalococcoidia bacterium]|nr:hypothetical protein [Dehalococcoidia bacterium]